MQPLVNFCSNKGKGLWNEYVTSHFVWASFPPKVQLRRAAWMLCLTTLRPCPYMQEPVFTFFFSLVYDMVSNQPNLSFFTTGLRLLYVFHICLFVCWSVRPTYHMHHNYITYIVAMRLYFTRLQQFRRLLCVTTMSSLAQIQVQIDTKK